MKAALFCGLHNLHLKACRLHIVGANFNQFQLLILPWRKWHFRRCKTNKGKHHIFFIMYACTEREREWNRKTIKCKLRDSIIDFKSHFCVMKRTFFSVFSTIKTKAKFRNGLKEEIIEWEGECNDCINMQCIVKRKSCFYSFACSRNEYK